MTEIYFDDYKMSDFVFARLKLNTAFTNINIKYYKRGIFTTYSKMRSRVKAIFYNYGVFDYLRFAMSGFIKGDNRQQATLFPEHLDDYISEENSTSTTVDHDRAQLYNLSMQAKSILGVDELNVLADRGYYSSKEIVDCENNYTTTDIPKSHTSNYAFSNKFNCTSEYRDEFACVVV